MANVKERGMLFGGAMVRAILEGRKTQTRRILKPQPPEIGGRLRHRVGDRLWVRETWREQPVGDDAHLEIQYKADFSDTELACYGRRGGYAPRRWRPAIVMPRRASRLDLEVTLVRVERLREITEEDALAEGLTLELCGDEPLTEEFFDVWDSYHDTPGHRSDADPWVEVIAFKVLGGADG